MNRDVRLKNRRIVSASEVLNDLLENAVCRLRRDKQVRNNSLPCHEAITASGSTPLLQLENDTSGISRINEAKQADALYFSVGNLPHCATASCDHCLQRFIDIF